MARRKIKRSEAPMREITHNQAESYEADDEGRDEDSPTPAQSNKPDPKPVKSPKPAKENKKKKVKSKKDNKEYEVDQVVDMEVNMRWLCPVKFRVRWVGYTEKDDTWVPLYNLNCDSIVQDFLQISGRKPEYEKALEHIRKNTETNSDYKESLRKSRSSVNYSEIYDDDAEVVMASGTRTRKPKPLDLFDPSDARPQLLHVSKRKQPNSFGISRAQARSQQAGHEYEVVQIVDHRVRGRFTEYKVRWKGLTASYDWVPEANLTCPKLIASYRKNMKNKPETDYEVAAIIDSREVEGQISYKVRWKGFSSKYDSWLPKEEMDCPQLITKFEAALEKLSKKEDWVVQSIKARRERDGQTQFLVQWSGFDSKHDTWEPENNLIGCKDKLDAFQEKLETKIKKRQRSVGIKDENDGSDKQESSSDDDKEVTVKSKKRSRSSVGGKDTASAASSGKSRTRRSKLQVSYEETDDSD